MTTDMAVRMKCLGNAVVFLVISCLSSIIYAAELHRKLETTVLCPNKHFCKRHPQGLTNLVYTKAVGVNDTLHYLYSTKGIPTVLVVQTNHHGKLVVDWEKFSGDQANNSIAFTGTVHYSYAILITKLLEYNDVNDTADLSDPDLNKDIRDNWKVHDMLSFETFWVNASKTCNETTNEVIFEINNSTLPDLFNKDGGSLQFKFKAYDIDGRNSQVPHLAYNANTTQIDVTLDNLTSTFNSSRFALEMVMVSLTGLKNDSSPDLEMTRSIDDEHSPGVFEIIDWTSKGDDQTQGGYVQWKPVCYTSSDRSFADLNRAKHYDLHVVKATDKVVPESSVAFAFLGESLYSQNVAVSATNVSFGLSKDKFYKNTNYVVWSASFGMGMPPVDSISPMIILIISLGFGLPALLIIFGGIGVSVKRWKGERMTFETIN